MPTTATSGPSEPASSAVVGGPGPAAETGRSSSSRSSRSRAVISAAEPLLGARAWAVAARVIPGWRRTSRSRSSAPCQRTTPARLGTSGIRATPRICSGDEYIADGGTTMRPLTGVRAVLLDMDGTLVDSDAAVERAWRAWSAAYGLDPRRAGEAGGGDPAGAPPRRAPPPAAPPPPGPR